MWQRNVARSNHKVCQNYAIDEDYIAKPEFYPWLLKVDNYWEKSAHNAKKMICWYVLFKNIYYVIERIACSCVAHFNHRKVPIRMIL